MKSFFLETGRPGEGGQEFLYVEMTADETEKLAEKTGTTRTKKYEGVLHLVLNSKLRLYLTKRKTVPRMVRIFDSKEDLEKLLNDLGYEL